MADDIRTKTLDEVLSIIDQIISAPTRRNGAPSKERQIRQKIEALRNQLPSVSRFEFTAIMCCNSMKCNPVEWPLDDLIWMLYSIQFAILLKERGGA